MQFNYKEQLADSRWLQKKAEILIRDNYTCQKCGAKSHLNVHHKEYKSGHLAWEYPDEVLVTLCRDCHEDLHFKENLGKMELINRGVWYMNWDSEFRTYAVVFHIDYVKKVIYLFGMNEGAWGSPWVFVVPYKEFQTKWEFIDMNAEADFYESGYFVSAFMYAYANLRNGIVSFDGNDDELIKVLASDYIAFLIRSTQHLKNYCDYNNVIYDF